MNRPHKILLTVDAVGGVWQYASELADALSPLGHQVILALVGPGLEESRRARVERIAGVTLIDTGLPLDWLAADAAAVAAAGEAIASLALDEGANLIQINHPALAASMTLPLPILAVMHSCVATWWEAMNGGALPPQFEWQKDLVHRGLRRSSAVVCPSAAFAQTVQQRYSLPAQPVIVHNGRSPLCGPQEKLGSFAFTAGRLWDRGKNVATLDRAAACLGVPFKAAGPLTGPNGERVAFDRLDAVGSLDERAIGDCLAARPVFVSAARYEPFGLAVLEAALVGCPLVLSDIPTFRELWSDSATFVDPDDADGFAAAIDALIGNTPHRLAWGERARRRALQFAPERMAIGMAAIYRRLLDPAAISRRNAA